jgi:hypothetical protein
MKKLVAALIMCLAIFGASPGIGSHPVSLNATMHNGVPDLLNPLAVSSTASTVAAEPTSYLAMISERTFTPDTNLLYGGALKRAAGHVIVIGSPLLC